MQWNATGKKRNPNQALASIASAFLTVVPGLKAEFFCIDFRYSPNPTNLVLCDFSILDIQSAPNLGPGHAAGKKFFSYLSVGQIAGNAPYLADVQSRGIRMVSYNTEWNSYYPDLSDPRWTSYIITVLAPIAINKGFDGFFLDTVDAVETLSGLEPHLAGAHHAGMVNIIRGLKEAHPSKQIILNRGFAVFNSVKTFLKGMLVEELFQRDDYTERSPLGVSQLLARIAPVTQAGLPVYIVDYVPTYDLSLADETSERISHLGFHPLIVPQELHGIVLAPRRPTIVSQPQGGNQFEGNPFTFSVSAAGTPPFSCQWRLNGNDIPGAQGTSYSLTHVGSSDSGPYSAFIHNAAGSVTSASAVLSVMAEDSDNDGMPDEWERTNGLKPNDSRDANDDSDSDRASNLEEFRSGTDPRDPLSNLTLRISRLTGNHLNLSFVAVAGRSYTLQYRTSLQSTPWLRYQDLSPQLLNRSLDVVFPNESTSSARFFRVVTPKVP